MKNKELANLHEELLYFLLNYRKASKYIDNPNFLFRPANDAEAFEEGRWFPDNPSSGWVDIYFTEGSQKRVYGNNLHFGVNSNGGWNIAFNICKDLRTQAPEPFWDDLIQSFSNVVSRHDRHHYATDFQTIILSPIDSDYRTGLPEAIDTLLQFLRQERNYAAHQDKNVIPISLVPEDIFHESLRAVNEYRNRQKIDHLYLNGFQVKNYQGIKETQLHDLPPAASWIFLTGENGFGKTCLLQALAIGLYGNEEDMITPRDKESKIQVNYCHTYRSAREIHIKNDIGQPLFFRALKTLAAYGPSRLAVQARDSHMQQAKNSTATYNLFHTDGILKNIESELLISYYDAPDQYEELCGMLKALIPSLDRIELDKKQRKIRYYEKAEAPGKGSHAFEPVEYEHLASGVKSIVAMAGDIYLRLSNGRQKMQDHSLLKQTDPEKYTGDDHTLSPNELFGIVIIDELDLHLHPKWQRILPTLLSEVFPRVQFIASTHSPVPLLGAPLHSVFLKVDRTIEKGIQVQRLTALEKEISNLLPNSILTSPIFDLEHIFQITHDRSQPVETADQYRTILERKRLDDELHLLARDYEFPENLQKKDDEKSR